MSTESRDVFFPEPMTHATFFARKHDWCILLSMILTVYSRWSLLSDYTSSHNSTIEINWEPGNMAVTISSGPHNCWISRSENLRGNPYPASLSAFTTNYPNILSKYSSIFSQDAKHLQYLLVRRTVHHRFPDNYARYSQILIPSTPYALYPLHIPAVFRLHRVWSRSRHAATGGNQRDWTSPRTGSSTDCSVCSIMLFNTYCMWIQTFSLGEGIAHSETHP